MQKQLKRYGAAEPMADASPEKSEKIKNNRNLITWIKDLLPARHSSNDSLRDAIEELIEEKDTAPGSSVAAHERQLISNILKLRDLPVVDVMVPRVNIFAMDINTSKEELTRLLAEKPHSRIPIYKGDLDNIIGFVHIKEMLVHIADGHPFELKDIMREALVVSPAMRVMDLLLQFRQSKVHIALVVDEFGGIDGLITINDLIEAIVGEISGEYEFDIEPQLIERPDGSAVADARYSISSFEERYGNVFHEDEENEDINTLGGLITALAGRVPSRGEVVRHPCGIEFEIIDADPRRIMRVRIRNLPKKNNPATQD